MASKSCIFSVCVLMIYGVVSDASDRNTTSNTPPQRLNEIPREDNVVVSLLTDIKYLLSNSQFDRNENSKTSIDKLEKEINYLSTETKQSVNSMASSFEKLSEKSNQNLELMLQSFSTLKMLVTVQSEQFKHVFGRIESLEQSVENFQREINTINKNIDAMKINITESIVKVEANIQTEKLLQINDRFKPIDDSPKLAELNKTIESRFSETNTSLRSFADKINELQRTVRNIKNDMDGVYEQLSKKVDISTDKKSDKLSENDCSCQAVRITMTRFTQEIMDQKRLSAQFKKQISQIEQYKNETGPEKFATAMVISRLGTIEKQIESLPEMESALNNLKNLTQLGGWNSNNTTMNSREFLCVWPYSPGAEGCFYVHTKDRHPWLEAREYCQGIQGDLASPIQFDRFRQHLIGKRLSRSYNLWVGGRDESKEGSWKWLDGRDIENTPKIWSTGRPNVDNRSNCMELRPTFRFVAADEDCRSHRQFVCEQKRI